MKSVSSPASRLWRRPHVCAPWSTDRLFFCIAKTRPVESAKFSFVPPDCPLHISARLLESTFVQGRYSYQQGAHHNAFSPVKRSSHQQLLQPLVMSESLNERLWAFWASFAEYLSANWPISIWSENPWKMSEELSSDILDLSQDHFINA